MSDESSIRRRADMITAIARFSIPLAVVVGTVVFVKHAWNFYDSWQEQQSSVVPVPMRRCEESPPLPRRRQSSDSVDNTGIQDRSRGEPSGSGTQSETVVVTGVSGNMNLNMGINQMKNRQGVGSVSEDDTDVVRSDVQVPPPAVLGHISSPEDPPAFNLPVEVSSSIYSPTPTLVASLTPLSQSDPMDRYHEVDIEPTTLLLSRSSSPGRSPGTFTATLPVIVTQLEESTSSPHFTSQPQPDDDQEQRQPEVEDSLPVQAESISQTTSLNTTSSPILEDSPSHAPLPSAPMIEVEQDPPVANEEYSSNSITSDSDYISYLPSPPFSPSMSEYQSLFSPSMSEYQSFPQSPTFSVIDMDSDSDTGTSSWVVSPTNSICTPTDEINGLGLEREDL